MNKNIFILQNTELESHMPLSVYLTELLKSSILLSDNNFSLIASNTENVSDKIKNNLKNLFLLDTDLYSIKNNIIFSWKSYRILAKENKTDKIDIIHCLYPNSSILGATVFKIFHNRKVKIIYDIRSPWIEMSFQRKHIKNFLSPIIKTFIHFEEYVLCKFVNYFVFISKGLKEYYIEKYRIKNISDSIIPSGVNTKLFQPVENNIRSKYNIGDDKVLLGIVSTLGTEREYKFVLEAFKDLSDTNDKFMLMIVGDGPDKENLIKLRDEFAHQNKVIFTGKIDHELVPEYISSFDVGLCHLPDLFVFRNSFPLKILEYLSCGVPVLASDIYAHQNISEDLGNIFIYKNKEDFINKVKSTTDKEFINIDNKLFEEYDWNSLSDKYLSIYKNV